MFGYVCVASACYADDDVGNIVAAASHKLWNNRRACGLVHKVKWLGATDQAPHPCNIDKNAYVLIADNCPKCTSTINLCKDAFFEIADPSAGRIKIELEQSFLKLLIFLLEKFKKKKNRVWTSYEIAKLNSLVKYPLFFFGQQCRCEQTTFVNKSPFQCEFINSLEYWSYEFTKLIIVKLWLRK